MCLSVETSQQLLALSARLHDLIACKYVCPWRLINTHRFISCCNDSYANWDFSDITNGLNNSWVSFVMLLNAMAPKLLKMMHVVVHLLNEEMHHESRDEETVSGKSEKVYVARGDSGSGSGCF